MHGVVLSSDLTVGSAVAAVGPQANVRITTAMSLAKLLEILHHEPVDVIVIDLQSQSVDRPLVDQLRALTAPGCQIAAFGPHVQEARLQAAHDAGCDHVWTRGQWSQQFRALIQLA